MADQRRQRGRLRDESKHSQDSQLLQHIEHFASALREDAEAAARERVKLRERAAPTFEHGFLGRGAFSEDRASADDEGLRRKLAARLCVDGDGPVLGRDAVVELQRRTLELYQSPAFRDVPKGDAAALDEFRKDLLGEFGFAGERGARAAERAVARFLDDEEVFSNAKRLFELCSGV